MEKSKYRCDLKTFTRIRSTTATIFFRKWDFVRNFSHFTKRITKTLYNILNWTKRQWYKPLRSPCVSDVAWPRDVAWRQCSHTSFSRAAFDSPLPAFDASVTTHVITQDFHPFISLCSRSVRKQSSQCPVHVGNFRPRRISAFALKRGHFEILQFRHFEMFPWAWCEKAYLTERWILNWPSGTENDMWTPFQQWRVRLMVCEKWALEPMSNEEGASVVTVERKITRGICGENSPKMRDLTFTNEPSHHKVQIVYTN